MDPFSECILKCLNKYKGLQRRPTIFQYDYIYTEIWLSKIFLKLYIVIYVLLY